jgi:spermidine synthase
MATAPIVNNPSRGFGHDAAASNALNLWLFEIGFFTILAQVVLLRELSVAFYGNELIYLFSLGFWLFWSAFGAAAGQKIDLPPRAVRWCWLAGAPLLCLDLAFIRRIQLTFGGLPGADLPLGVQLCVTAGALMPLSSIFGWLFQNVCKQLATPRAIPNQSRHVLAHSYAIESAGGLVGGVFATYALDLGWSNLSIAIFGGMVPVIAALHPVANHGTIERRSRPWWSASLTAAFLFFALAYCPTIDRWWTSWNHPRVLGTADTPYGRVTVTGRLGQVSVFENNALSFDSESIDVEELVHVAASIHPHPKSFLLLGGAARGTIREVQKYAPDKLVAIELDRRTWQLTSRYLPPGYIAQPHLPAPDLCFADPRQFLNETGERYDVILVSMPEPNSAQNTRYYTQEFFALCARRLTARGIVAFRLRSAENFWTPHLAQRTASIYAALTAAIGSAAIFPGNANLFIASRQALPRDPSEPAARLRARQIETRLVTPLYINYLYTNDRLQYISNKTLNTRVPPNRDAQPICYRYTLLDWLSKFEPRLAALDLHQILTWITDHAVLGWLMAVGLLLAFRIANRWPSLSRALLAGMAGFSGIVGESLLLVRYQITSGVLYRDLGLLVTLFMTGLVIGSFAVHRLASTSRLPFSRWFGMAIMACMAALYASFGAMDLFMPLKALISVGGALVTTAALSAGVFACASFKQVDQPAAVISPLYAADLAGGCLGSMVAGLILIPLVGISDGFFAIAILALIALVLW